MALKRKILHISKSNSLEEPLSIKGFAYRHFNYLPFYEEDNIIDMWQRLFVVCHQYKPHLILLQFEHDNCINDNERKSLEKFAVTLNIYG